MRLKAKLLSGKCGMALIQLPRALPVAAVIYNAAAASCLCRSWKLARLQWEVFFFVTFPVTGCILVLQRRDWLKFVHRGAFHAGSVRTSDASAGLCAKWLDVNVVFFQWKYDKSANFHFPCWLSYIPLTAKGQFSWCQAASSAFKRRRALWQENTANLSHTSMCFAVHLISRHLMELMVITLYEIDENSVFVRQLQPLRRHNVTLHECASSRDSKECVTLHSLRYTNWVFIAC